MKKYVCSLLRLLVIAGVVLFPCGESLAQCQTIIASVTGTSPAADPADSVIKICKGTTVTFTGAATFSGNGTGATYEWHFNNGSTVLPGISVSQNFPDEGVYVVDLVVTDANGCVNKNCDSRRVIQVSTTPHFDQIVKPDTICLHQTAGIQGVVTPVEGVYNCAPPVSGTTYLPDGNGVSYTTSIDVTCFTPCDTVRSATDIQSICMNIEHSYVGDLIVTIACPNGQSTLLFDGNTGGDGWTYLGDAIDNTTPNTPGVGFDYCFSSTAAWGTLPAENAAGNHVLAGNPVDESMTPGSYKPQGSYNNLIGCPLNGNWTITVTDDAFADDGYIFGWDINFSQGLGGYTFTPTYPQQTWAPHADITGTSNGGKDITIKPETNGNALHCYTFQVVDSFNCPYDTTVCVYVVDPGNPGADTSVRICLNHDPVNAFDYLGGNPEPGGSWSGSGVSAAGVFNPNAAGVGTHAVVYRQQRWNCDTTATILFDVLNNVDVNFAYKLQPACDQDTISFVNLSDTGSYWWSYGDGTFPDDTLRNPVHIYQDQDVYQVRLTVKSKDGCIDSIIKSVDTRHPLVAAFNRSTDSVCQTEGTPIQFTDASIGAVTGWLWHFDDGATSAQQHPVHTYSLAGNREVRLVINDAIPCYDTVYHTIYVDSLPFLQVVPDRHALCQGDQVHFDPQYLYTIRDINWNFGDGSQWSQKGATSHGYDLPGTYPLTVTGDFPVCADVVLHDSVVVHAYPVVYLGPDSVLCLDGPALTVADQRNAGNPAISWLWSTGATTASIEIVHPGDYWITATGNGCATTENITVNKDCYTDIPNAFTPNGDGHNDYFYPRQLLSQGVSSFSMSVFNRWGQKVFESNSPNGRGWDGRFNEQEQPVGVYVYQVKATFKNGRTEAYSGNVTLIR